MTSASNIQSHFQMTIIKWVSHFFNQNQPKPDRMVFQIQPRLETSLPEISTVCMDIYISNMDLLMNLISQMGFWWIYSVLMLASLQEPRGMVLPVDYCIIHLAPLRSNTLNIIMSSTILPENLEIKKTNYRSCNTTGRVQDKLQTLQVYHSIKPPSCHLIYQ